MGQKVTEGTFRFIEASVGHGKPNKQGDVRTIQQLLIAAGFPCGKDRTGKWGSDTQTALSTYINEKSKGRFANLVPKFQLHIEPGDPLPTLMAYDAAVLIPLPCKTGAKGLLELQNWLSNTGIHYQKGAEKGGGNRAIWGVFGNQKFAVQTVGKFLNIKKGPPLLDCTTYASMMMAVYFEGNCHRTYKASLAATGGGSSKTEHIGKNRYNMVLVESDKKSSDGAPLNYVKGYEEIRNKTASYPTKLHHIELAGTKWVDGKKIYGFITHMALLYDGMVYECSYSLDGCVKRTLAGFMADKESRVIYLFREV